MRANRLLSIVVILATSVLPGMGSQAPWPKDKDIVQTPQTLQQVIQGVRTLKANNESNQQIAAYVARVIDGHITNGNSPEVVQTWVGTSLGIDKRGPTFDRDRETFEKGNGNGREYEGRAKWSWDLGFGCCEEIAAISYYVFKEAGIPARIVKVPGHAFTVIGLEEGATIKDASTWGKNAYICDGWSGEGASSSPAEEMMEKGPFWNRFLWGRRSDSNRGDGTLEYDNPQKHEKYLHSGYLAGTVVDAAKNNQPVAGARVLIKGPATEILVTDARGNFEMLITFPVPEGNYQVVALSPTGIKPNRSSPVVQVMVKGSHETTHVLLTFPKVEDAQQVVWVLKGGGPQFLDGGKNHGWDGVHSKLQRHYVYTSSRLKPTVRENMRPGTLSYVNWFFDKHKNQLLADLRYDFTFQTEVPRVLRPRDPSFRLTLRSTVTGKVAQGWTESFSLRGVGKGLKVTGPYHLLLGSYKSYQDEGKDFVRQAEVSWQVKLPVAPEERIYFTLITGLSSSKDLPLLSFEYERQVVTQEELDVLLAK